MESLKNFFYPGSICVVGASTKEKSIGYEILRTIKSYGFTGRIFPVNPKADQVLEYKCFHAIEEIKEEIDLAIVVVQKQFAESSVDSLLSKGVKAIILITAGFKEIGSDGLELENRILHKIKDAGARLLGPNCMGVINTHNSIKLNATFVAEKPENGTTGFLSQSGALGAAVLNSLRDTDIKFAHFVSVGNKADINENDILYFWQDDKNIKIMTFYLESFVNGKDFILPFIKRDITKPAVVLKAGRTDGGMKAASSHTGALSGKDKVADALLNQFGVIRAADLNELFNSAKGFEAFKIPNGNKIAVVTNAGGPAILCVDSLENENLVLAKFSDETKRKLREIVNPEGSVENPVDLLPGGNAEVFKTVNEIVLNDMNVDAVISIFVEPVMVEPFDVIEKINSIQSEKPLLQVVMPLPEFWAKYRNNSSERLPLFRNPEDPAKVLSNMLFFASSQKRLEKNQKEYSGLLSLGSAEHKNYKPGFLSVREIEDLCRVYDLPLIKSKIINTEEIKNFDDNFYPVVLKGLNKNVVHKTEMSAVKINIKDKYELLERAGEITSGFSKAGYTVEEFLVQQYVKIKHELLIGGFRDPSFGPVVVFGSGGKYVEVFNDTAIKSCFITDDDIDDMISSTKMGKILLGVRNKIPADIPGLKRIIKQCAKLMLEHNEIEELDFNPLIISDNNDFSIVDARIKVH